MNIDTSEQSQLEKFSRYEFKYVLNSQTRKHIEDEISHFMRYDGHVHPELKNRYFVRSLYFDNDLYSHYHEKTDGIRSRKKFRMRTYGREFQEGVPIYFEMKGRHIDRTYKHRVAIDFDHIPLFQDPKQVFQLLDIYPNNWLIEQFVYDTLRKHIKPCVLIDYLRRPYTSDYDMNFRLTFDDSLNACPSSELFYNDPNSWRQCISGYCILEVKFHRRIPAWFHKVIQANDLRRRSISKFCEGIEYCGLADES